MGSHRYINSIVLRASNRMSRNWIKKYLKAHDPNIPLLGSVFFFFVIGKIGNNKITKATCEIREFTSISGGFWIELQIFFFVFSLYGILTLLYTKY